ncbi:tryptophan 2,3-dioxygenase [Lysinibacillus alkalisoli]|uniref:Tryptophan 2,3-dioxygenase n=1 Tax=Lysinibacillus alkalisoli TaxID=1911548 RepID=A0A917G863_9BACI|nr:tryptophan 2,3-dioxygenase [Lysinibacillus alkalisoli]GGG27898.1 tryptophan 2,3-dioxygenase [Lysinibacillus alkalisoli]
MTQHKQPFEGEKNIVTNFENRMTYTDYLHLNDVLACQQPLTDEHDEMLFITVHHISELWMKQILHEVKSATKDMQAERLPEAFKKLARVSQVQNQLKNVWDVLATLTPADYLKFRDSLGNSSGFQSYQNRLLEFYFGYKTPHILKIYAHEPKIAVQLQEAYEAPSLYDEAIRILAKRGFAIDEAVLQRDLTQKYEANDSVKEAWKAVYRAPETYFELYELAEELVDIEDLFQQWRFRHMKTVERIIGFKKGTGGSGGVSYLKKVLDQYFFPELWQLRTEL